PVHESLHSAATRQLLERRQPPTVRGAPKGRPRASRRPPRVRPSADQGTATLLERTFVPSLLRVRRPPSAQPRSGALLSIAAPGVPTDGDLLGDERGPPRDARAAICDPARGLRGGHGPGRAPASGRNRAPSGSPGRGRSNLDLTPPSVATRQPLNSPEPRRRYRARDAERAGAHRRGWG